MNNELFLKTVFCCMACDGEIANEELALVKSVATNQAVFEGLDISSKLSEYVEDIQRDGNEFLTSFLKELSAAQLSEHAELQIVKLAIDTIEADNNIEYSEISFFKRIRAKLQISDEAILAELPEKEDYLLPDINETDGQDWTMSFENISLNLP
ncbi:MAG: TerB family tellurite resistance protein [Bacteroidales bacterium]|nr:TerB family tellurite resistance protein [Bacteroidales bacterium]